MEEITKILKEIQRDLQCQKEEMKEMQSNITNIINSNVNEKFKEIESKHCILSQKLEEQQGKIEYLERLGRKKNLVFFGIAEDEENYFQLQAKIINFLNENMKMSCDISDIEYIRRIGKKQATPRPIIVTFLTMGKKLETIRNRKYLKGSKYNINEDFPRHILEKRKNLQAELQKQREQGKFAVLKYDKIVILNKRTQRNEYSKKRALSSSPVINKTQKFSTNSQQAKKNKNSITGFFTARHEKESLEPISLTSQGPESSRNK
ncbi:unnamed protein product [Euphydryas editha]|uniref:Endonuclease-reverse transcriptase n=1 Tax=Euphydryas editha TaxID=104508 RepID=A0AAU9V0D1_EUPED|nr:unnamed protein product [Euphydryas editha]